jgi:hypothetical protein
MIQLCVTLLCRYNLPDAPGFLLKPLLSLGSLFTKSPEQGAETSIYLATSPEVEGVSGKYFDDCKPVTTSKESYDPEVSSRGASACKGGQVPDHLRCN